MSAYYHHVGSDGAKKDFPKTIYRSIQVSSVVSKIPPASPEALRLIAAIHSAFPEGECNAWGVPAGAKYVISRLAPGDVVFLIESLRFVEPGLACVCRVDAYAPIRLPELSQALWQSDKFPYIFFFKTKVADVAWDDFRELLGYPPNYSPRGKFLSILDKRVHAHGGVDGLLGKIGEIQLGYPLAGSLEVQQPPPVADEIGPLVSSIEHLSQTTQPCLLDDDARKSSISQRPTRDAAFARAILKHYKYQCAVCGSGVRAPSGRYELEAAHICAVTKGGPDDLRNGLALCRFHHWTFDNGLWALGHMNTVEVLPGLQHSPGVDRLRAHAGLPLRVLPATCQPHPFFANVHRIAHKFPPL